MASLFRGINSETITQDLIFVLTQELDVLHQFAEMAIQFGKNDQSGKATFPSVAETLEVDAETVAGGVDALTYIFVQSARLSLSPDEFEVQLRDECGFEGEDSTGIMVGLYTDNHESLRDLLVATDRSLPIRRYHNMDWRLEAQVASRAVHHTVEPMYTLQMDTVEPTGKRMLDSDGDGNISMAEKKSFGGKAEFWNANVSDLAHVTAKLDEALKESRSAASIRVRSGVK